MKRILFVLLILISGLLYAEIEISCTAVADLNIPYTFRDTYTLSNGNIQFINPVINNGNIQFYGFQYDHASMSFTEQVLIGELPNSFNIPSFQEDNELLTSIRNGYIYYFYKLSAGFVMYRVNQNELFTFSRNNNSLMDFFRSRIEVGQGDDIFVIYSNAFVKYNTITDDSLQICTGDYTPGIFPLATVFTLYPSYVVFIPNEKNATPETWIFCDFEGNIVRTESVYCPAVLYYEFIGSAKFGYIKHFGNSWYLTTFSPNITSNQVELTIDATDSLRFYEMYAGFNNDYLQQDLCSLGSDKIIIPVANQDIGILGAYTYNYPIIDNTETLGSFSGSGNYQQINPDMFIAYSDSAQTLRIVAVCNENFPEMYRFDMQLTTSELGSVNLKFASNDTLYIVTDDHLYSFYIQKTNAINDNINAIPDTKLLAWPNPFNYSTSLQIKTEDEKPGTLEIFNIKGQKVKTIAVENKKNVIWDAKNEAGHLVSSGFYMLRYTSDKIVKQKKVLLLK